MTGFDRPCLAVLKAAAGFVPTLSLLALCSFLAGCPRPATGPARGGGSDAAGRDETARQEEEQGAQPAGGAPGLPPALGSAKEGYPRVRLQDAILSPDGKLAMTRYVLTQGSHFPYGFKPWRLWDT